MKIPGCPAPTGPSTDGVLWMCKHYGYFASQANMSTVPCWPVLSLASSQVASESLWLGKPREFPWCCHKASIADQGFWTFTFCIFSRQLKPCNWQFASHQVNLGTRFLEGRTWQGLGWTCESFLRLELPGCLWGGWDGEQEEEEGGWGGAVKWSVYSHSPQVTFKWDKIIL